MKVCSLKYGKFRTGWLNYTVDQRLCYYINEACLLFHTSRSSIAVTQPDYVLNLIGHFKQNFAYAKTLMQIICAVTVPLFSILPLLLKSEAFY